MKKTCTFIIILISALIRAQSVTTIDFISADLSLLAEYVSMDNVLEELMPGTLSGQDNILTLGLLQSDIINEVSGEKVIEPKEKISVYPNPFIDYLIVKFNEINEKKVTVRLIDITGKVRLENEVTINSKKQDLQLDVKDLNKGIYFISILAEDKLLKRIKLYKK